MSNLPWLTVINKTTHRVTVKNNNYVITVGHFSKGGPDDISVRRCYDWKGVHLIWYGEIRSLKTGKFAHVSKSSKQQVIDSLIQFVSHKNNGII